MVHCAPEAAARFYDPTTGSFLSRDPLNVLTRSPYAYVYGNPVNATDPSGLCWPDWACGIENAVGVGGIGDAIGGALGQSPAGCSDPSNPGGRLVSGWVSPFVGQVPAPPNDPFSGPDIKKSIDDFENFIYKHTDLNAGGCFIWFCRSAYYDRDQGLVYSDRHAAGLEAGLTAGIRSAPQSDWGGGGCLSGAFAYGATICLGRGGNWSVGFSGGLGGSVSWW